VREKRRSVLAAASSGMGVRSWPRSHACTICCVLLALAPPLPMDANAIFYFGNMLSSLIFSFSGIQLCRHVSRCQPVRENFILHLAARREPDSWLAAGGVEHSMWLTLRAVIADAPTPALQTKLVAADHDANLHGVLLPMLNQLGIELLDVVACSSVAKLNESEGAMGKNGKLLHASFIHEGLN
jgi:hypothetical protein